MMLKKWACDRCRKSKTKCDGNKPCGRCQKRRTLCTVEGTPCSTEPEIYGNLMSNQLMATVYMRYLENFFSPSIINMDWKNTGPESLPKFAAISVCARSFGNPFVSDFFYNKATVAAKEVYDDMDADHLTMAIGFLLLAWSSSPHSFNKLKHYTSISLSFLKMLDDSEDLDRKIKKRFIVLCAESLCPSSPDIEKFRKYLDDDLLCELDNAPDNQKYIIAGLKFIQTIQQTKQATCNLIPTYNLILTDEFNEKTGMIQAGAVDIEHCHDILTALDSVDPLLSKLPTEESAIVFSQRTALYQAMGNKDQAIESGRYFFKSLKKLSEVCLSPDLFLLPSVFILGRMFLENGDIELCDEAISYLSKLTESYPLARRAFSALYTIKSVYLSAQSDPLNDNHHLNFSSSPSSTDDVKESFEILDEHNCNQEIENILKDIIG